eukprot:2217600-Pleurochrysis_carterae.AAC.1
MHVKLRERVTSMLCWHLSTAGAFIASAPSPLPSRTPQLSAASQTAPTPRCEPPKDWTLLHEQGKQSRAHRIDETLAGGVGDELEQYVVQVPHNFLTANFHLNALATIITNSECGPFRKAHVFDSTPSNSICGNTERISQLGAAVS